MDKLLKWNPEFAKNVWLELSVQRLIAMPAIILLIAVLVLTSTGNSWDTLHYISMGGFTLVGMLWGLKSASDAILDEYNERTWDWQRMSIIGPFRLAIGKLFGSTIYNWYGALIFLLLFLLTALRMENTVRELKLGVLMVLGMITLHGLMMLMSLQMIRKADGRNKIKSNRLFIVGIVLLGFMSNFVRSGIMNLGAGYFSWYGILNDPTDLSIISSAFYCFWVVAGLYRSMRTELQYSDAPVWWLSFLVSSLVFQFGYLSHIPSLSLTAGLAILFAVNFFQYVVMVYFLALSEPKDIVNLRLLQNNFTAGNFKTFFENIPLWLFTLPVAFMVGLLAVGFFALTNSTNELFEKMHLEGTTKAFMFLIAVMGFVVRDLGILLLLNFSSRARRADGAMMVYLVLLYILIPMVLKDYGIGTIFYPDITANSLMMVLFPLIEAAVVLVIVVKRWNELKEKAKG